MVGPIKSHWLLDDTTTLTTTNKTINSGYKWNIFISEGKGDNVKRPLWIDVER
jgi:hypothetical protein